MPDVLVVDRSRTWTKTVALSLANAGLTSAVAHATADALGALAAAEPAKVVVLEIVEGGIDGFRPLAMMRDEPRLRAVRIVIVTAWTLPALLERINAVGADHVLIQSQFSLSELVEGVNRFTE